MFSPADHARLRDRLAAVQGRFILTINDVPEIRALYADERFSIEPVGVTYSISSTPTAARELIITGGG
jgi:DNA adenine methylase